jgi:hypothetical protein
MCAPNGIGTRKLIMRALNGGATDTAEFSFMVTVLQQ